MDYFFSLPEEERAELVKKFWSKVDKKGPNECWLWNSTVDRAKGGYGIIFWDNKRWKAHRLSWMINYNAGIPEGLFACHTCDVRLCSNPFHIFIGTVLQNNRDSMAKDRKFKIKLPVRIQIAQDVRNNMTLKEAAKKYKIKDYQRVQACINHPSVVAIIGRTDVSSRKGFGWRKNK